MKNYAIWIQTVFIIDIKTEDFHEDIADDVKNSIDHYHYLKSVDHYLQERIKKR